MSKYLIYVNTSFVVEGEDEVDAKKKAEPILSALEQVCKEKEVTFQIESAKVADKKTGFFV